MACLGGSNDGPEIGAFGVTDVVEMTHRMWDRQPRKEALEF